MSEPRHPGIVVIGAGGHAKVIIELLRAEGHEPAYCISSAGSPGSDCLGVPVLVGDAHSQTLWDSGHRQAIVAIGSNRLRENLAREVARIGFEFVNAISPRASISPSATLGRGIAIMAGAVINAEARIGDHSIVNTSSSVDHDCVVGAAVHVAPNSAIAGNARIGDRAFLGIGSTVLPGMTIGPDVQIGAGSVVLSDVAEGTVVGVPARPISTKRA